MSAAAATATRCPDCHADPDERLWCERCNGNGHVAWPVETPQPGNPQ